MSQSLDLSPPHPLPSPVFKVDMQVAVVQATPNIISENYDYMIISG